jgi:hypothetical protein
MPILLLLIPWILFFFIIPYGFRAWAGDWRLRLIASAALTGGCLILITEGLSAFNLLRHNILLVTWAGISFLLGMGLLILRKRTKGVPSVPVRAVRLTWLELTLLVLICLLALVTGVIAYVAAPNNADAMLYHLVRVAHWQQEGSVAFFPAHNLKQLVFSPFAEYVLLHFHILTGADRFDNLLQWWAMLLAAAGVSYLAKKLGARRPVQIFAALFALTLPMGIFQSSTAQNDHVLSAWVVALVCFGFAYYEEPHFRHALIFGLLLGLAVFTKATAYLFCPVIVLWLAWAARKKLFFRKLPHILLVVLLVFCLNLPFWLRNYALSGNPLGPADLTRLHSNEKISLYGTALNLFRNAGANILLPHGWAVKLTGNLNAAFQALHLDLNDPRYTFLDHRFAIPDLSFDYINEDSVGSPLHLLLIVVVLACFPVYRKRTAQREWLFYISAWLVMLVLFSSYIRWQLYGNRLLLPWFVLAAPFTSQGISLLFSSNRPEPAQEHKRTFAAILRWVHTPTGMLFLAAGVLSLSTLPLFYFNPTKPLWQDWNIFNLPRREVMLHNRNLLPDYVAATDAVIAQDCRSIGLVTDGSQWEYPIWSLLRDAWGDSFRMENVLVENISGKIPLQSFSPCALLVLREGQADEITYANVPYQRVLNLEYVDVYARE